METNFHEELINFLANPYETRTQEAFCKEQNISLSTLWRYRKAHPELEQQVKEQLDKVIIMLRPTALRALASKIKSDTAALKMYFQMSGDLVEKQEIINHMTVEQKRDLANDLIKRYSQKLEKKPE